MHPQYRALFNDQIDDARYQWYQQELESRLDVEFEFRLAETPLFLTDDFTRRAVDAGTAIVEQLSDPQRIAEMRAAIPERWNTPGMDALPNFSQVDFAVVDENGTLVPKLIELQGFPSLTCLQVVQRDAWRDTMRSMHGLDREWSCWFSGLNRDSFIDLAK